MDMRCYSSCITVDLDVLNENLKKIRSYTGGVGVIPVVKSNAYGFGTAEIGNYLASCCGMKMMAVARLYEAIEIQDTGADTEILILGPISYEGIPVALERKIQFPLFQIDFAKSVSRWATRLNLSSVKVHLKLETGMNRIGVRPGAELDTLLTELRALGNLEIDGVFTHFATATQVNHGAGNDFCRQQFSLFQLGVQQIRKAGFHPRFIHCCNTGATTWLKKAFSLCTHVRVGSLYLGYSSVEDDWNPIGVVESASWHTKIVNINHIHPGESCGYDRAFMPLQEATIAVIPVGYGDGYLRSLAMNHAPVLVNGQRRPFVGICMDVGFIDITGLDCHIGDTVTLFGEDEMGNSIPGLEIGHIMGESRLAMFTHISQRVGRAYVLREKRSKEADFTK